MTAIRLKKVSSQAAQIPAIPGPGTVAAEGESLPLPAPETVPEPEPDPLADPQAESEPESPDEKSPYRLDD